MDNQQNDVSGRNGSRKYVKKAIIFLVLILILVAAATFFDFLGKIGKPSGTATLSWDANTEPDLAGYKIYYGDSKRTGDCSSGGYSEKIDVGRTATPNKPTYKIENLEEDKTYYFSVTSYDASGNESCFSGEMSKNIPKTETLLNLSNFLKIN